MTTARHQETRLDQLRQEADAMRLALATKRSELETWLNSLTLE